MVGPASNTVEPALSVVGSWDRLVVKNKILEAGCDRPFVKVKLIHVACVRGRSHGIRVTIAKILLDAVRAAELAAKLHVDALI